jgi:hypothetical protein
MSVLPTAAATPIRTPRPPTQVPRTALPTLPIATPARTAAPMGDRNWETATVMTSIPGLRHRRSSKLRAHPTLMDWTTTGTKWPANRCGARLRDVPTPHREAHCQINIPQGESVPAAGRRPLAPWLLVGLCHCARTLVFGIENNGILSLTIP